MKLSLGRSFQQLDTSYNSNKRNDTMTEGDIYSKPTSSESYDIEENMSIHSDSQRSSDSEGLDLQIPSGYLSPTRKNSQSGAGNAHSNRMTGTCKDEDRLLMLAKHPHATEEQVLETLYRKQKMKEAREQRKEQQSQQTRGGTQGQQACHVRFAPAFPVDADTGEAWDRQARTTSWRSSERTSAKGETIKVPIGLAETSFDRAWAVDTEAEHYPTNKQSTFQHFWCRIFPRYAVSSHSCNQERDESVLSRQEESLCISVTSDKTPKISNVNESAKRCCQETGYSAFGDRLERFRRKVFRTKEGLIILGILLVLLLSIVVTILATLVSQSDDIPATSIKDGTLNQPSSDTFFPRSEEDGSAGGFVTSSPTGVAFQSSPPTASTSTAGNLPTQSPSQPTMQTLRPTISPTLKATTIAPTQFPSLLPALPATDMPTSRPTMFPTLASVAAPTMPPLSPSQVPSFVIQDSAPLTAVGASLIGNAFDQRFGKALSLSHDGRVLAVGAPSATIGTLSQAGMVQVFEWSEVGSGSWQPRGLPLVGRNEGDEFGSDVALSADGSILIASEPAYTGSTGSRSGNVRTFVYRTTSNDPAQNSYVDLGNDLSGLAALDHFGFSISLSADGRRLAVGAPYHDNGGSRRNISGQVTVYDFIEDGLLGGSWQLLSTMSGTDHLDWFGWKVDLDADGEVMCVGAPRNLEFGGYVECHDLSTNLVLGAPIRNSVQPLRHDDNFGHALKLSSAAGNNTIRVAIGAPGKNGIVLDSGLVVVYEYNSLVDQWSMLGRSISAESPQSEDALGFSIDFHEDVLIIGSPGAQRVDRYFLTSTQGSFQWEQYREPLRGDFNSTFGYTVEQQGGRLAVGSEQIAGSNTGMVNVYQRSYDI